MQREIKRQGQQLTQEAVRPIKGSNRKEKGQHPKSLYERDLATSRQIEEMMLAQVGGPIEVKDKNGKNYFDLLSFDKELIEKRRIVNCCGKVKFHLTDGRELILDTINNKVSAIKYKDKDSEVYAYFNWGGYNKYNNGQIIRELDAFDRYEVKNGAINGSVTVPFVVKTAAKDPTKRNHIALLTRHYGEEGNYYRVTGLPKNRTGVIKTEHYFTGEEITLKIREGKLKSDILHNDNINYMRAIATNNGRNALSKMHNYEHIGAFGNPWRI